MSQRVPNLFLCYFIVALILHWVQIQMWPAQFEWTSVQEEMAVMISVGVCFECTQMSSEHVE